MTPAISVVIPTFRRLPLLRRAVESVKAQTFSDWELIISTDDPTDLATHAFLSEEASRDSRIRLSVNPGPPGQASNLNNGLRLARGTWIKPLFDDDRLLPECLSVFHSATARFPDVVLAGCLAQRYRDGRLVRTDRAPTRAYMEVVKQEHAHLAMYLQDFECGSMPTQMLVRADAVVGKAWMPQDTRLVSGIDQLWFAEILRHGDRLHLAAVLVEEHQGQHETVTSKARPEDLDNDSILIREYLRDLVPTHVKKPPPHVIKEMVYGVRGLHRCLQGRFYEGMCLLKRVRTAAAIRLIGQWTARKLAPGYFCATPRLRYYD